MTTLRYITHPNVAIDPAVAVPSWSLDDVGRERTEAMLAQPWIATTSRVISSGETKAIETATILADHLGLTVEVREDSGETDRSSTGYVPHGEHLALAGRFFAEPERSADGWETAAAAQTRIVEALSDLLADDANDGEQDDDTGDIAVVGHGAVGTLLLCHLAGLPIHRQHDQPGQGHYWSLDRNTSTVLHRWLPIDQLPMS